MSLSSLPVQSLLSEYTDTLSSLPNELTRSFSDLRELDAVLRSSIEAITRKIHHLTALIESEAASPSERLVLMLEIADDAQRLKMGSEDKIRVAGKACEELVHTRTQVSSLLSAISASIPHFSESLHVHSTTYPHVAPSSLLPVTGEYSSGRRKRIPAASNHNLISARDGYSTISPAKKRRLDDDAVSVGSGPSGKSSKPKPKPSHDAADYYRKTQVGNGYAASNNSRGSGGNGGIRPVSRSNGGDIRASQAPPNKTPRSRLRDLAMGQSRLRKGTNLLDVVASRGAGGGRAFEDDDYASSLGLGTRSPNNLTAHHEDPLYANGHAHGNSHNYAHGYGVGSLDEMGADPDPRQRQASVSSSIHNAGSNSHQPSSRAAASKSRATVAAAAADEYEMEINGYGDMDVDMVGAAGGVDDGDDGADVDERKYCYCDRVSFGEMIACDDDTCAREWFHLGCIGLTAPPKGEWFCDSCLSKREDRGERKSRARGGGRGGGKRPKGRGQGGASHLRAKSSTALSSTAAAPHSAAGSVVGGSGGAATPNATVVDPEYIGDIPIVKNPTDPGQSAASASADAETDSRAAAVVTKLAPDSDAPVTDSILPATLIATSAVTA